MKLLIAFVSVVLISGCGASHHLRRAEYHIAKAESKGAKWKEEIKTDTIYKDTTIFVEGGTMDDTFAFTDRDTVTIEKEKIVTKIVVDCLNKKGNVEIKCPDKIIKVPQKFYVNRRITRTINSGYTLWHLIGFTLFGLFAGIAGVHGYYALRPKPK